MNLFHLLAQSARSAAPSNLPASLGRATADDEGQTMAEYTFVLAFIAVVAVAGYMLMATPIIGAIDSARSAFP